MGILMGKYFNGKFCYYCKFSNFQTSNKFNFYINESKKKCGNFFEMQFVLKLCLNLLIFFILSKSVKHEYFLICMQSNNIHNKIIR